MKCSRTQGIIGTPWEIVRYSEMNSVLNAVQSLDSKMLSSADVSLITI